MGDDVLAWVPPIQLNRCASTSRSAPFRDSSPAPLAGSVVQGDMNVSASVGAANQIWSIFTIKDVARVNTRSQAVVNVAAVVRVDRGELDVWSVPFPFGSWAAANLTLNMVVKNGAVEMCRSSERVLARTDGAGHAFAPIGLQAPLRCFFNRPPNAPETEYTVEVSLGAWAMAGGLWAGAWSNATAKLMRIDTQTCVEPGVLVDGSGQCAKPITPAVEFSQVRSVECDGTPDTRWTFQFTTRQIRHNASGLCLEALPPLSDGSYVLLRTCAPSNPNQRWTRQADGSWRCEASASMCLDGRNWGAPNDRLQMWSCHVSPVGSNQRWTLQ